MAVSFGDWGSEESLLRSRRHALRFSAWFEVAVALCAAIAFVFGEANALRSGEHPGWFVAFSLYVAITYAVCGIGCYVRSFAPVVPRAEFRQRRNWRATLVRSSAVGVVMPAWSYVGYALAGNAAGAEILLVVAAAVSVPTLIVLALDKKARA